MPIRRQQLWIVDIYGFLIAGFLVTMGTLGDRIGRKKLLLIGMGGLTLGPLFGGVLLEHFWWGSVFLVGVPGLVLLLVFGPSLLPDQKAPEAGKLDPVSVALSLLTILPFVYGLKELARNGWEWFPAAPLVFGIAVGVVFVQRQRQLEHPLLDLRMFGNRTFQLRADPDVRDQRGGHRHPPARHVVPAERHRPHPAGSRPASGGAQCADGLAVLALRAFRHLRNSPGGDDDTTKNGNVTDPKPEATED